MKNSKKMMLALALCATTVASMGAMTSCDIAGTVGGLLGGLGGEQTPAVEVTGVYLSDNDIQYMNFNPQYNYFTCTMSTQVLTTYSDNTYALETTSIVYSNIKTGADVPTEEFTANDKGTKVLTYYGTFTAEADEEDWNITLNKPTRMTYQETGYILMDSAVEYAEDVTYGVIGFETNNIPYNEYSKTLLEKFEGAEVYVVGSKASFKFVKMA